MSWHVRFRHVQMLGIKGRIRYLTSVRSSSINLGIVAVSRIEAKKVSGTIEEQDTFIYSLSNLLEHYMILCGRFNARDHHHDRCAMPSHTRRDSRDLSDRSS